MTTIDFHTTTMRSTAREAVALRAVKWIASAYNTWQNRRAFYRLSQLSDVELHDIGLTRGDLSVAVTLGTDPTRHLGTVANFRRNSVEPNFATRI